jgi:predicted short-subunit dehydrogenase-like oxidoreductase (DUF2520 family)
VGHTSGATPLTALDPAARAGAGVFGWHPLQTFAGSEGAAGAAPADGDPGGAGPAGGDASDPADLFAGAGCAIAGSTRAALEFAERLAGGLGMTAFEIDDSGRAAYHAAASMASNFLLALKAAAEEVAGGAGLEPEEARALLLPLIRQTVENHAAVGPERALTGPVARGDEETVAAQRAAVAETAPHLLALFDELVEQTRRLAGRGVTA